ncbi:methylenetetrahydrofolate reductase [bacterium]|nr:methylenetetrahydrofolate reductase [bacterium]
MARLSVNTERFTITVEVVPPEGPQTEALLTALQSLQQLPIDGFSVATNPVAKPRMSAMALCALLQQQTDRPAILHCTTRDHNRLSLQGMLWGALALGIETVLVTTGDFVALGDRATTTNVRDTDVLGLVAMARDSGLHTGVVLDPGPESQGLEKPVRRLERKIEAGAQFVVTQPYYDEAGLDELAAATGHIEIPIILGILPLRSARHAEFLHQKVAGINVPRQVRNRMNRAENPVAEGIANAREMLNLARERLAGACLMPPFDRFGMLTGILADGS